MWKLVNLVLTHWRAAAVCVALLVQSVVVWQVQEWRWTSRLEASRRESAEQTAESYRGALERLQEALREADAANRRADSAIRRLKKDRDAWKKALNDAQTSDPDCAAWSQGAIRCPLPSV